MNFDPILLKSELPGWASPPPSTGAVQGLYDPMHFVVRLNSQVQSTLGSLGSGGSTSALLRPKVIASFSTYLHETIHWWQHVGSTLGLVLSLSFPAQTHLNHNLLRSLLPRIGPKKSLRRLDVLSKQSLSDDVQQDLNRVLNNWHDLEACYRHIITPRSAPEWVEDAFFESVGHSYEMMWGACIWLLSASIDSEMKVLPNIRSWEDGFGELRRRKVVGYYHGSDVHLPLIGGREIFEGQARFSQLQYLHFASGRTENWNDFERLGLLDGVYVTAFHLFLKLIEEVVPSSVDDPLVAMFLMVCDLAINPTDGFPFDIRYYESFIADVDPGMRFVLLCYVLREKHPTMKRAITTYSRQEYVEVAEVLSRELVCPSPLAAADRVTNWPIHHAGFRALLKEDETFRFASTNLPVRLFVARFLNFQRDKLKNPEFFVWPGAWMVARRGGPPLEEAAILFNRNEPLFLDTPDGEVRPRIIAGRTEFDIQEAFNNFYSWNASYNLVRQWTAADGPFDFDFSWLSPGATPDETRAWATRIFEQSFGVDPSRFEIL